MKPFIISITVIGILLISALILFNKSQGPQTSVSFPTSTPVIQNEKVDIKASFTIITGNITRSFKSEKYHNKSPDVYIESSNPTIVHVTKAGITWNDFFQTLPMKLTKDCLTTGDDETFCEGKDGTLKFFLNDIKDKDLLDKEIKQNDKILVKFTSK